MRQLCALVAVGLVLSGCSLSRDEPDGQTADNRTETTPSPVGTPQSDVPTADGSAEPTTEPTTEPPSTTEPPDDNGFPSASEIREQGTVGTCDALSDAFDEDFCADANGNVWPDFVDEGIGRDPMTDECTQSDCADGSVEDFLAEVQGNTLFILDASGSMAGDAGGGTTKMQAAREALVRYVSGTPEFVDIGLMVYGHQGDNSDAGRPESCAGIETFSPIGDLTADNVESVVSQFEATGWTPIGASLEAAAPVLQDAATADEQEGTMGATSRVVLISDGIETCDGDPVAAAQGLSESGIDVVVDVIGFDLSEADSQSLRQVAEVTGGTYSDARTGVDLTDILSQYNAQNERLRDVAACQGQAAAAFSECGTSVRMQATEFLRQLEPGADGSETSESDRERRQFLRDWQAQAQAEDSERREGVMADLGDRFDELVQAYDDAAARQRELTGGTRKVSASPFVCPFAPTVPHAA